MFNANIINFRNFQIPAADCKTNPAASYQSLAGDLANMSTEKRKTVPSIAQSIDTVLDTPPARQTIRPLAKLRPSWIGPARLDRPRTPGAEAMKQHVIVEYSSAALQPPVYIFTSLSDPQWDAVEMQAEKGSDGQYRFSKTFDAEAGEYQYKFRLGPGDWWVYDEGRPTVDDGMGNKNNLLVVKAEPPKPLQPKDDRTDSKAPSPTALKPTTMSLPPPSLEAPAIKTPKAEEVHHPAPLFKHESFHPPKGSESQQTPEQEVQDPLVQGDDPHAETKDEPESTSDKNEDSSSSSSDDEADNTPASPLLRHESLVPSSIEQEHAPLFRHESISLGNNRHDLEAVTEAPVKVKPRAVSRSSIPDEADPNDPSLEKFPTDHTGIMNTIHRAHTKFPEDETSDHSLHHAPLSQAISSSSISSPSLASVHEGDEDDQDEDEEALEKIREAEEEEYEREEADGEELDPLKEGVASLTPPLTDDEPEDADFEPKVGHHHHHHEPEVIIQETVVIEVMEKRSVLGDLVAMMGGKGNALAIAVGLLVVAAGIASLQLM